MAPNFVGEPQPGPSCPQCGAAMLFTLKGPASQVPARIQVALNAAIGKGQTDDVEAARELFDGILVPKCLSCGSMPGNTEPTDTDREKAREWLDKWYGPHGEWWDDKLTELLAQARIAGMEEGAGLLCNFCADGLMFDAGQQKHAVSACVCGHGSTYHRPYCHANCNCREFSQNQSGIKTYITCSARVIRARIAALKEKR